MATIASRNMTAPAMRKRLLPIGVAALLLCGTAASAVTPLSTAFTYQGQLKLSGSPVSASADFQFTLWDDPAAGSQIGSMVPVNNVTVASGLFTVSLDFSAGAFAGQARWLGISVRSPAGSGAFAPLTPRQPLTAGPYSLFSAAPWITSGANVSYTAGNVGIGTSSPLAKLHVGTGDIRLDANRELLFADNGQIRSSDNNHRILFRRSENKMELREFGDLIFSPGSGGGVETAKMVIKANGNVGIGTTTPAAALDVVGIANVSGAITAPSATIPILNGNVQVFGEMTAQVVTVLGGSDVAEPYEVAAAGDVKPLPGMVVSIDPDRIGQMRVASRAYDKTVAGILSGANGISPGITLRQKGTVADGALPVASIGRVWCWCDAGAGGAIEAGDMLTTSNTTGHAMKVTSFERANGSTIGKAMSPLKSGRGLVLVLVSLK